MSQNLLYSQNTEGEKSIKLESLATFAYTLKHQWLSWFLNLLLFYFLNTEIKNGGQTEESDASTPTTSNTDARCNFLDLS